MSSELSGKRALVTGSTAGIGLATAVGLAAAGADVVVNGRTEKRVARAVETVRTRVPGALVSGVAADVSTAEGCTALAAKAPEIDVLVNNVGIFEPRGFVSITDDDWMRLFETNVMSGVRLVRHYLPRMREIDWGRIVFVSSESAVQIPAEMIHYGMTKTAQVAIARGLAESLTGTGITVNAVLPGPTRSEGVGRFVEELAAERGMEADQVEREFFETARPSSILKRFLRVDEVAAMIVYLCTPRASGTTGSALRVDGGVVRAVL
jgi:NAD(P)-dependent dehydrogenase (short-subunit alcohol dehydrogenase family)